MGGFADSISSLLCIISESPSTWLQPSVLIFTWAETPSPSSSWLSSCLSFCFLYFLWYFILKLFSSFLHFPFSFIASWYQEVFLCPQSSHYSLNFPKSTSPFSRCCVDFLFCFVVLNVSLYFLFSVSLCIPSFPPALGEVCGSTNIFHTEPDSLFPVLCECSQTLLSAAQREK